jgi:hypothetical protein
VPVPSSKGAVTVNPAFLRSIKQGHQDLWQSLAELEQLCDKPIGHRLTRLIVDKIVEFHEQFIMQVSLEETFGYISNPICAPLHLCRDACRARDEHEYLLKSLKQIVDEAEQMLFEERYFELWVWVGQRFLGFAKRLREHEAKECALILKAFVNSANETGIGLADETRGARSRNDASEVAC